MTSFRRGLGVDAICFVDDDPFERAEVHAALPTVLCLDHGQLPFLLQMPELKPEELRNLGRRTYDGYVVKLYYQDKFMGEQAAPTAHPLVVVRTGSPAIHVRRFD